MTTQISKQACLRIAACAVLSFSAMIGVANAQQGPSLEDLQVIDAQQGGYVDPAQTLADDARHQDPSLDSMTPPVSPDLRYADPATVERIEDQMHGNYGSIDRSVGMPLGTTQDAWNDPYENMAQGQVAPGVVRFHWSQEMTMPVRMREFMNTLIILPDWEEVKDVYLGESVYFQTKKIRSNTIAVRVSAAGIDTNMNILGASGNLYTFYLRAEGYNTRSITDMQVFIDAAPVNPGMWFDGGPGDRAGSEGGFGGSYVGAPAPRRAEPTAVQGSNLYIPSLDLKFVHKMFEVNPGDRAIAPEYVATDGRWTYFWYGDKAGMVDRPVVYRLVDGVEERVATRTIGAKGETLVAEAVGEFVLRNGQKTVCIKVDVDGTVTIE